MGGLIRNQAAALIGAGAGICTLGGDGLVTLGDDRMVTLGGDGLVTFGGDGLDGIGLLLLVAVWKISAMVRRAARRWIGSGGNGVFGVAVVSARIRSWAAWATVSAGEMVGILQWCGKNSAVPVIRMPLVSGI